MMVSDQVLRVCARFGIEPRCGDIEKRREAADRVAASLLNLGRGEIAMVTGPSGGGKSLIMRSLAKARARGVRRFVVRGAMGTRGAGAGAGRVIDQFDGPLADSLAMLARAGLSEAHVLAAEVRSLSEGQRFRLALAVALHRAARGVGQFRLPGGVPPLILVDEFASMLDRTTAKTVARMFRRCVRACGVRAVVATGHDDVLESLAPDVLVWQPLAGEALVVREGDV
jgi:ABC-type ATPase with predicted acetyltransferase domain